MAARRRRRLWLMAATFALAAGVGLAAMASGLLDRLEESTVDARFEVRGEGKPRPDVAIVAVDARSLAELKMPWPFPRRVQAQLVKRLRRYDPKVIAYDVQLTEASSDEAGDQALYSAVSHARPMVLATTTVLPGGKTTIFGGDDVLRDAGARPGSGLFPAGTGAVTRRLPFSTYDLESLAVVTGEVARGARAPKKADYGDDGAWIDFAGGRGTYPAYSFSHVLRGEVPRDALRGKVVVVGATDRTLQDIHPTSSAGDDLMSGPELQANAIATVLDGIPLRSVADWVDVLLVILMAALAPVAMLKLPVTRTLLLSVAALALYLVGAQLAFDNGKVVTVVYPIVGLVVGTAGATTVEYVTEVRERRRLRGVFARFVPEPVVDAVVDQADEERGLPGVELDATILFCDLRGFTSYSEKQSAATVIDVLNVYLGEMSDALLEAGGTVTAYMGDGIMAVFGAPVPNEVHADQALAAAREMTGPRLERFNSWLRERGLGEDFRMGVGLNTGSVMSGTVGSARRMEYTTVGDATNVASRLEGMTKTVGTPVLMAETTYERLSDKSGLREMGEVEVRGRTAPMRVWGV